MPRHHQPLPKWGHWAHYVHWLHWFHGFHWFRSLQPSVVSNDHCAVYPCTTCKCDCVSICVRVCSSWTFCTACLEYFEWNMYQNKNHHSRVPTIWKQSWNKMHKTNVQLSNTYLIHFNSIPHKNLETIGKPHSPTLQSPMVLPRLGSFFRFWSAFYHRSPGLRRLRCEENPKENQKGLIRYTNDVLMYWYTNKWQKTIKNFPQCKRVCVLFHCFFSMSFQLRVSLQLLRDRLPPQPGDI